MTYIANALIYKIPYTSADIFFFQLEEWTAMSNATTYE